MWTELFLLYCSPQIIWWERALWLALRFPGGEMCCCQASKWPLAMCDCRGLFWVLTGRRESYLINQQLMVCACIYTYLKKKKSKLLQRCPTCLYLAVRPLAHLSNALQAALARIKSVHNSLWRGLARTEQGNGQVLAMVLSLTVVI